MLAADETAAVWLARLVGRGSAGWSYPYVGKQPMARMDRTARRYAATSA